MELLFRCGDREFRVKRNPEYLRPKKSGAGFTKATADCELELPNQSVITKRSEVDDKIHAIIGLDSRQFMQIAMIAQGDFKKLLLASTEDRKKIFRQIFKTENYESLQQKLKNEYTQSKRRLDDAGKSVEALGRINKADENSLKAFDEQLSGIEKRLAVLNADLGKIDEYNKAKTNAEKVKKQIESESEKLTVLQEEVSRAQEAYKEVDTLTADVGTLKAEMPDYEKHENLAKSLQTLEKGIKASAEKAIKLSEKLTSEKENIEKLKAEKVTLEGAAEEKLRKESERGEADKKRSALKAIKLRIDGYAKETAALEKTQTACNKAIIVAENFANEYNEMNTAFLREQAGILADELKDGQPCPVCGSLEHPSPAQKSEKAPTKKQVKDAKKRADDAQKSAQNLSAECAKLKGMLDNERESIQKQLKENDVEAELHEATQLLKDALNQISTRRRNCSKMPSQT